MSSDADSEDSGYESEYDMISHKESHRNCYVKHQKSKNRSYYKSKKLQSTNIYDDTIDDELKHIKNIGKLQRVRKNKRKLRKKERMYFKTTIKPKTNRQHYKLYCSNKIEGFEPYSKFWDFIDKYNYKLYDSKDSSSSSSYDSYGASCKCGKYWNIDPFCYCSDFGDSADDYQQIYNNIKERNKSQQLKNTKYTQKHMVKVKINLCSDCQISIDLYTQNKYNNGYDELFLNKEFIKDLDKISIDINNLNKTDLYTICQCYFKQLFPTKHEYRQIYGHRTYTFSRSVPICYYFQNIFYFDPQWELEDDNDIITSVLNLCDMFYNQYNLPMDIANIICNQYLSYNIISNILISGLWMTRMSYPKYSKFKECMKTLIVTDWKM